MARVRIASFLFVALLPGLAAQEVVMSDGERIAGAVLSVTGSSAKLRGADGALRTVSVRSLDHERLADGTKKRHAATLVAGGLDEPTRAVLTRLQKGQDGLELELLERTAKATQELIDALTGIANGKGKGRTTAARALLATGTREGVAAGLAAARADASGALWKGIGPALANPACLAAIAALDARAELEAQLKHPDRAVRYACAWAAVELESKDALPVLATFVTDADHHVREAAATSLAEHGDASGASLLVAMCKRERSPAMDANKAADAETQALVARLTRRERIHSCELLGALKFTAAVPTLTALAKHRDAELAKAAAQALAAIQG